MPPIRNTRTRHALINAYAEGYISAMLGHAAIRESPLPAGVYSPYLAIAQQYQDGLRSIYAARYIQPRKRGSKSGDLRRVLHEYSTENFQRILRLSPTQLFELIARVWHSPHFKIRQGENRHSAIELRLMVALFRLGSKGVSVHKVAWIFGIGVGSVHAYTWQSIYAIVDLQAHLIVWPDAAKKEEISAGFRERMFPDAIGVVDGVPIPFDMAPSYHRPEWNTRKCHYAMGATAVCDHQGRFTFVSTGYIGSMHDAYAYKKTDLYSQPDDFFQGREYILGDAAYMVTRTVIPRYKNAQGYQARFNTLHGRARVVIEHAFGMLKLKFQSLQNLPVKINRRSDIGKASAWVIACMVLHNFLRLHLDNELVDEVVVREIALMDAGGVQLPNPALAVGHDRQEGLDRRNRLLEWMERNDRR